jgi:hypothetical protein
MPSGSILGTDEDSMNEESRKILGTIARLENASYLLIATLIGMAVFGVGQTLHKANHYLTSQGHKNPKVLLLPSWRCGTFTELNFRRSDGNREYLCVKQIKGRLSNQYSTK